MLTFVIWSVVLFFAFIFIGGMISSAKARHDFNEGNRRYHERLN